MRVRRRVHPDPIAVTSRESVRTASDAAFAVVCVGLSALALYLLTLGIVIDGLAR